MGEGPRWRVHRFAEADRIRVIAVDHGGGGRPTVDAPYWTVYPPLSDRKVGKAVVRVQRWCDRQNTLEALASKLANQQTIKNP